MSFTFNDFLLGIFGGLLIGIAAAILWLGFGRIAGISEITSILLFQKQDRTWRCFSDDVGVFLN